METALQQLPLFLGGAWASGINLYLTMAFLGIAHKAHWITLPGSLENIAHPLVIATAVVICVVELVVDKIPYLDNAWDSIHTLIRPVGGLLLGYLATTDLASVLQVPIAMLTGSVALNAHVTKATARLAMNSSPAVVATPAASVGENISVATVLYFIIKHPIIASIIVIGFIAFSIWFLRLMFRFVRKLFRREPADRPTAAPASSAPNTSSS